MNKIRLGVVGLGHRGRHMFRLAKSFDYVELAAACDLDRALWYESQWDQPPMCADVPGAVFYEDFEEMLEKSTLDVLLVETGADIHADFCRRGFEKGLHIFSDIPTVATLEEADMLWKITAESDRLFMVGANPNEYGFIRALLDLYSKGLIGEPFYMEAEYIHCEHGPLRKLLTEHSPWRNHMPPIRYCTHSLGPLLMLLKEELRSVTCFSTGRQITTLGDSDSDSPDLMTAQFQTASGVIVKIMTSFRNYTGIGPHSYRIFGTEGYFEHLSGRGEHSPERTLFNSTQLYGARGLTALPIGSMPNEYMYEKNATGHGGVDYALFDKFFKALRSGQKMAPTTIQKGLRMTIPGIYAAESAKRGGEVMTMHYPWEAEWKAGF